jgi:hypothetical protein
MCGWSIVGHLERQEVADGVGSRRRRARRHLRERSGNENGRTEYGYGEEEYVGHNPKVGKEKEKEN